MKTKIALLYGGKSAEHDVSLATAKAVIGAVDKNKFEIYPIYINREGTWIEGPLLEAEVDEVKNLVYDQISNEESNHLVLLTKNQVDTAKAFDIVFPLLHGPNGEDGTVQGLLELLGLPYVGNGVLASAAGMDKIVMKNIFAQAGLRQAKYVHFLRSEWLSNKQSCYDQVGEHLGYPCFVKPANLGSSVGISKCLDQVQLEAAFAEAFQYDRKVIIEEMIHGREIEISVLGNDNPECSVAGELAVDKGFYDYNAKYIDGKTNLTIPARLADDEYQEMVEMSKTAFKALDCSGLVRADFFLAEDGKIYINEVNTMPGFTPISMFPLLWQKTGVSYSELIEKLVALGIERHQEKQLIKYTC